MIKRIVEGSLANEDLPWYEETLEEMCVPLLRYYAASCCDAHDDPWVLVPKGTAEALWEASKQGEAMFVPVVIEGVECLLLSLFHGNDRAVQKDGPHTIWGCAIPRVLIDETR